MTRIHTQSVGTSGATDDDSCRRRRLGPGRALLQRGDRITAVPPTATLSAERGRLPGVDGIWALIGADAVIFAVMFGSFMQERLHSPEVFEASRQTLNMNLGGIDTLILLTSSWSVALAMQALKRDLVDRVPRYLLAGVLTGLLFMGCKAIEYVEKLMHGVTPATNSFYMWYFTLTGAHLFHVALGTALLSFIWIRSRRGRYRSANRAVPECVASFWHLVDLLWLVLFPLLYLMKAG